MNEIIRWVRSSRCSNGACVEVAVEDGRVLVRDSKLGEESPVLAFSPSDWRTFLATARD